jgi:hypothetical protein
MKNITTLLYEVLASLPTGDPDRDKIGSAKAARNSSLAILFLCYTMVKSHAAKFGL